MKEKIERALKHKSSNYIALGITLIALGLVAFTDTTLTEVSVALPVIFVALGYSTKKQTQDDK